MPKSAHRVLFVAAENDAVAGAKVGGVGDVVRDVPKALAMQGIKVDVVIPDYGNPQIAGQKTEVSRFTVPFRHNQEEVVLYRLDINETPGVNQFLLSHPLFENQGRVYCNDAPGRPFATDASKFALFSLATCEAVLQGHLPEPRVFHLHDWHSALCSLLLKTAPRYQRLSGVRLVYTVHNIALQGIRPFNGDESSLEAWFPWLSYDGVTLCDPRYPQCFNPVRCAIHFADAIHLVSPSYAEEVLRPSQPENGFYGGEGLELELQRASQQGKLSGILNGCEYPDDDAIAPEPRAFFAHAQESLLRWMAEYSAIPSVHFIAHQRLQQWLSTPSKGPLVTSIGRLTDQKVLLLRQMAPGNDKKTSVLDVICTMLERVGGRLIILGSGDKEIEQEFCAVMARSPALVFLNGYGQSLSDDLYQLGDMFLMPSSFEPCGISQMLALRAGQPCIVHNVGGLKDTIMEGFNGFSFSGNDVPAQCRELLACIGAALRTYIDEPERWALLRENARTSRFEWRDVAIRYIDELYRLGS